MTKVHLRPFRDSDCDQVLVWRNAPDVRSNMYTDQVIEPLTHQRWFEAALRSDDASHFIIEQDDNPVGVASLTGRTSTHRRVAWAFYLGEASTRGRGIGRGVEFLMQRFAFEVVGANKLTCEVLAFNSAVIAMHKKLGFSEEGILREHVWRGDGPHDVHVFGMLKSDWQRLRDDFARELAARDMTVSMVLT